MRSNGWYAMARLECQLMDTMKSRRTRLEYVKSSKDWKMRLSLKIIRNTARVPAFLSCSMTAKANQYMLCGEFQREALRLPSW